MKHNVLRRFGALTLAFAMALSLMVVPALAYVGSIEGLTIAANGKDIAGPAPAIEMKVGETVTLAVRPTDTADTETYTYNWGIDPKDNGTHIEFVDQNENAATRTIRATSAGELGLTVMTPIKNDNPGEGEEFGNLGVYLSIKVTEVPPVTEPDPPIVKLTNFTLAPTTLELEIDEVKELTITPTPADADTSGITWSSVPSGIVSVVDGKVTGLKAGTTTVTATDDGTKISRTCNVTVKAGTVHIDSITFTPNTRVADQGKTSAVVPTIAPSTATDTVRWESSDPPVLRAERTAGSSNGWSGSLIGVKPGKVTVTAYAVDANGHDTGVKGVLEVEVTGIAIEPNVLTLTEGGRATTIVCVPYGAAKTNSTPVQWSSSDPSIVAVSGANNSCLITPLKVGSVTITANKGSGYSASCTVTVQEDYSSIIGPVNAPTGQPLLISSLYNELDNQSIQKTEVRDANGNVTVPGSRLSYITNLSVSTAQGVLYYNYNSAANTGDGVGMLDKFYPNAYSGQKSMSALSFVPNKSFSGVAEIRYTGWAVNGENFSGTIRVNVNNTAGSGGGIFYDTVAGQPADFQADDFNAFCMNRNGRNLSYVTFTLPSVSQGVLYYHYTGQSTSSRVTAGARYYLAGSSTISGVSFVPNAGTSGTVNISYRAYDTAGTSYTGQVTIYVSSGGTVGDVTDVFLTSQTGQPAVFSASRFNDACRATLGETLSYVRLSLPAASEGVLYYNYRSNGSYESRVDTASRYYYSGTPGIGNITFVPAANAPAQVVIPYTGYSTSGSTYTGSIRIGASTAAQGTINYAVAKSHQVSFQVNDFNSVCLQQTGSSMNYVYFTVLPSATMGVLYHNYRSNLTNNTRVATNTPYYRTANYSNQLGYISFLAGSTSGTVSVPFYGYSTNNVRFEGTVVIQVGATTPADINLSGSTASQFWLSSAAIRSACSAVMTQDLTYIEITSLPTEKQGRVYVGYNGIGTGVAAKTGTKYYRAGSPSIDQLSFVPYGGFNGTATITYIGYSSYGEQVSGQIKISVTNSTRSQYFNDMGGHAWAADAVDFLYTNNISNGVGGGRYAPSATLKRGDFILMLVRVFGFDSNQIYRFTDVPSSSYYAKAISTARALGIISGSGKFYPETAVSRQDAMVWLYNAMKASGKTMTNGLAADLSGFSDRDSIADYAREAVGALVQMGVVKGDGNGRLRPAGTLTRAETAILLQYVLTL